MTDDLLALDNQLCFPIYAASNMLNRLYRPLLDELGLTYPQYLVMLVLWQSTPRSVGELGHTLYLDSGTLTPLLKRMEAQGLIRRQRAPDDERRVLITLTEAGHTLRERANAVPNAMLCKIDTPSGELAQLREQLKGLTQKLDQALARRQ
ncbi:MarR family winged helix-turn-helix transcriptional regulator [Uliginosibacterium gangwonense]|uniref:MarR family winged helix-turn-helix transcriptional regulator n=1 Tax=Uliginosibacterium gangwonense TaxID=392736 RepID=UPI00037FCA81|nr:MarR family transcriptional regulator [Uliginosibacterium gangwonense]